MELFHSVEFYVVIFMVAALIVGLLARPGNVGPVETDFTEGFLHLSAEGTDATPRLEFECKPDGTVKITRYGLQLDNAAVVALAITRKGFDISIEERITPDAVALLSSERQPADTATFFLSGLANERYHIRYNSEPTSTFSALTLANRPGLHATRILTNA